MAKPRANGKTLDSYTLKGTNQSIRAGDCVLMRSPDPVKPSYVAKVKKIVSDSGGSEVNVHIQWYYRPEDTVLGRRLFHGIKELFISHHNDIQSVDTIEGKCKVHSFKNYTKLKAAGDDDFYSRFKYSCNSGKLYPPIVEVFCRCLLPRNPDVLMIQCEGCSDWFHPACIDMTAEEALQIGHFFCQSCLADERRIMHP